MTRHKPVHTTRARKSATMSGCGHFVLTGQRIYYFADDGEWLCGRCADQRTKKQCHRDLLGTDLQPGHAKP